MSERIMKVLANVAQGLTEEEKLQARTNIGAIGGVKVADSSGTTELVPDENGKVTVDLTDVGNVPPFSGSDNGLVLGVVGSSDPELQWVSKGGGGTSYTAGDGIDIDANDVISAKVDGTSIGVNASGELESIVTVDQHYDASSTNAQSGTAVAEAMSGVSGVPSVGSGDDGKVLTADYTGGSGTFSWQDPPTQEQADWAQTNTSAVDFIKNKPTINNVPAVGSSDDGKVLTADYTGGVGSYSWVTPSGGSSYTAGNGISIANDTISAKVDGSSITVNTSGELQATASSLQTKPLVAGTGITLTASASDVTISSDSSLIQELNYGDSEASRVATLLIDSDDPEGYAQIKADNVTKGHLVMGPYKGLLDSGLNGGSGKGDSTTPLYIDGNGQFVTCAEMQKKLTAGYRISIGPGANNTTVIANTMHESVVNTCLIWDTLTNNYDFDYYWGNWRCHVHLAAFSDWAQDDGAIHIRIEHVYKSEAAQKIKCGSYQVQNYYPYQGVNTYDFTNSHWYYNGTDPYTTATSPDPYGFKFHLNPTTPTRQMPTDQKAHRFIVDTGAPYGEWLELDASVRYLVPNAAPSGNAIYLLLKGKYAYSYQ